MHFTDAYVKNCSRDMIELTTKHTHEIHDLMEENLDLKTRVRGLEAEAAAREAQLDALRDRVGCLEGHLHGLQVFGGFGFW